jgi:hypothetical protein
MLLMASCLLITVRAICLLGVGHRVLLSLNLKTFPEEATSAEDDQLLHLRTSFNILFYKLFNPWLNIL